VAFGDKTLPQFRLSAKNLGIGCARRNTPCGRSASSPAGGDYVLSPAARRFFQGHSRDGDTASLEAGKNSFLLPDHLQPLLLLKKARPGMDTALDDITLIFMTSMSSCG